MVVVDDSVGITGAVFTADERVKAERLSQTDVAVGSSDARWTHTLTTDRITQSTSTLTACTHTQPRYYMPTPRRHCRTGRIYTNNDILQYTTSGSLKLEK